MNREERIKLAINNGYTCNPETGDIFGINGKLIRGKTRGYITFRVYDKLGKNYAIKGHQFVYYCMFDNIVDCIDHINGIKTDNRIENLRSVTHQKNQFNRKSTKGYTFDKVSKKYRAQIRIDTKLNNIGYFDTEDEAKKAYLDAKKIYHII